MFSWHQDTCGSWWSGRPWGSSSSTDGVFVICGGTDRSRLVPAQGEISTRNKVRRSGVPVERLATNTTVQIMFPHYCVEGKISPISRSALLSSFGWFFRGDWQRGPGASEILLWWLLNGVIIQMKGNYPNPALPSALQYLSFFPFSDSTHAAPSRAIHHARDLIPPVRHLSFLSLLTMLPCLHRLNLLFPVV